MMVVRSKRAGRVAPQAEDGQQKRVASCFDSEVLSEVGDLRSKQIYCLFRQQEVQQNNNAEYSVTGLHVLLDVAHEIGQLALELQRVWLLRK